MPMVHNQLVGEEEQSSALARIDAQDITYVEPLREFLHAAGCAVYINRETPDTPMYWIFVGDSEFVKAYTAGKKSASTKRLYIIYEGEVSDELRERLGGKVVLVDPVPLTTQTTRDIFAYFFTGKQSVHDARKGLGKRKVVSVIPKQQSREQAVSVSIQETQDSSRVADIMKQIFTPIPGNSEKRSARKSRGSMAQKVLLGFMLGIFVPILLYGFSCVLSVGFLYGGSVALLGGNSTVAQQLTAQSIRSAQNATSLLQLVAVPMQVVGAEGFARDQELFLSVVTDIAKSERAVIGVLDTGKRIVTGFLSPDLHKGQPTGLADVLALRAEVSQVVQHLSLVQSELDSLLLSSRFPFSIGKLQKLAHQGIGKLVTLRQMTEYAQRLLTLYPHVGGFRKKQTYLVLLQNSMELRPTGGFIGSILLVSFVDGRLDNLEVQDVYTADGQLKGHVDPPFPIQSLLGQEHWYLRDSNWDPDFSKSGPLAAWFYEKEMNTTVDGVIALSLPLVTRLLEVTGPLELPDFNERISANNFFAKSLLYTQTDFFPGSTQKKDFLGSLTNALLLRLTTDKGLSAAALFAAIANSIEGRDLQFYFNDPTVQGIVSQWGWSGSVGFAPCMYVLKDIPCVSDGVGVVQANLGVNKVNYFVQQEASSRITMHPNGDILQETTLTLNNTSTTQGHDGGGEYRSYTRFLFPKTTELLSVMIDGQEIEQSDPHKKTASVSSVRVERTENSVSVGVPVHVGLHAQRQVFVRTISRGALPVSPTHIYQFALRKQAGVKSMPWHVTIEYPDRWDANTDLTLAKPGVLEYNTDLVRDGLLKVMFTSSL